MLETPADYLVESIADSAAFHTWIGATGTGPEKNAAAKLQIYKYAKDEADITRPCAFIMRGPDYEAERIGHGSADEYRHTGSLVLQLEQDLPADTDLDAAFAAFSAVTEAIIDDLLEVSGGGGYLSIQRLRKTEGPGLGYADQEEKIILEKYEVYWG